MNTICEQCRKNGEKLMLKGERCLSVKCAMLKRAYAPGAHGGKSDSRPSKKSEYGKQLIEKQKARAIYGIREKQFKGYLPKAMKMEGNTAENLLKLLESRLDNIVYRLGFAPTRPSARQMVSHGLVKVNGKKVSIASYITRPGDEIEPKHKEKYAEMQSGAPAWLEIDLKKKAGKIKRLPLREEIDTPVNESLIVEFYSR